MPASASSVMLSEKCAAHRPWMVTLLLTAPLLAFCPLQSAVQERAPVPLIFDTDMESDVDDVGALAMVHALADRGEVDILAVMVSALNPWSAACANRINTYFGRPDLPIGNIKGKGVLRNSRYAERIAKEFPGAMKNGDVAPDAVELYRKTLAAQTDGSVVIVTVGYKTNLRNLLDSGPCAHSELSGRVLVKRKVRLWVCMGGHFPKGREANLLWDAQASFDAVNNWPTEITFNGWEIGKDIKTGGRLAELPEDNPVRRSYQLFNNLKPHYSWDQAALLYAVRGLGDGPAADYWQLSPPGRIVINAEDGRNAWNDDLDGMHRYHIQRHDPKLIAEEIDALMMHVPDRRKSAAPLGPPGAVTYYELEEPPANRPDFETETENRFPW